MFYKLGKLNWELSWHKHKEYNSLLWNSLALRIVNWSAVAFMDKMVIGMSGAKQLELSTCPEQTMLLSFILVSEQIRFNYLDEIHILKYHKSETNKKSDYKILLFIWTFWRYFTVSCCLQTKRYSTVSPNIGSL